MLVGGLVAVAASTNDTNQLNSAARQLAGRSPRTFWDLTALTTSDLSAIGAP